ncbi:nucleolin 1-like protein isoform X3 [Tanacetum coccineum]
MEELRATLDGHFGEFGKITRLSISKDYEYGGPNGFADNKAHELSGTEVHGGIINLQEAKPRGDGCSRDRGILMTVGVAEENEAGLVVAEMVDVAVT